MRELVFFDGHRSILARLGPGETADHAAQALASPTLVRVEKAGEPANSPEVMAAVRREIARRRKNETLFERARESARQAQATRRWFGPAVELGQ